MKCNNCRQPNLPYQKVVNYCPVHLHNGVDGPVNAITVDKFGLVYVGGQFVNVANEGNNILTANNIAQWNNCAWVVLGQGLNNYVNAIVTDSAGNVYVAGEFTLATNADSSTVTANYIVQWNGSIWVALSTGTDGEVLSLAIDSKDNLYLAGNFTTAGGVTVNNIAKWDGTVFTALSTGFAGSIVLSVAVDNCGLVYAGLNTSYFTSGFNYIAVWNGTLWKNLDHGVNGQVNALAVDWHNNLFVGGEFDGAGNVYAKNIAMWDGVSWWSVGVGVDGAVYCIDVTCGEDVIIGGYFKWATNANKKNTLVNNLARWDGEQWEAILDGADNIVNAVATNEKCDLFIGGVFTGASSSASYIVKFRATCHRFTEWKKLPCEIKACLNKNLPRVPVEFNSSCQCK